MAKSPDPRPFYPVLPSPCFPLAGRSTSPVPVPVDGGRVWCQRAAVGVCFLLLVGCDPVGSNAPAFSPPADAPSQASPAATASLPTTDLLYQSWIAYRQRFIQADGRVIDREDADRSTSEAQAYALLRAVFIDDAETFERVLNWSENNLQRRQPDGTRQDYLWAWQWGRQGDNRWTVLDANIASDGDLDAATALILAARRWHREDYLTLAQRKLQDLWQEATIEVPDSPTTPPTTDPEAAPSSPDPAASSTTRYFLPGSRHLFQLQSTHQLQPTHWILNPSYLAPYAFRLFAQVDPDRDWLRLVDSSYFVLEQSSQLSELGLPSNWVLLDSTTHTLQPMEPSSPQQSIYGFDAYRVWWRVSLDAAWFKAPQAQRYLDRHLTALATQWHQYQFIPAQIDRHGIFLVPYESTAQYAMVYAAFRQTNSPVAEQLYQQKLLPAYQNGFWDHESAYYAQNLSWLGLFPPAEIRSHWLAQTESPSPSSELSIDQLEFNSIGFHSGFDILPVWLISGSG